MIRCAFADSFRFATLIPARFSPSISLSSTRGSTTTPLPITHVFAELVTLGAQIKARRLADQSEEATRARREMIDWILSGNGPKVDLDAAAEVKHLGLIARYDDE